MSDLKNLLALPTLLTLDGVELRLVPLRLRQHDAVMALVEPLMGNLARGDLMGALTENKPQMVELLAQLCGQSREWVDELYLADAVLLAATLWEINQDFFVRRAKSTLERLALWKMIFPPGLGSASAPLPSTVAEAGSASPSG